MGLVTDRMSVVENTTRTTTYVEVVIWCVDEEKTEMQWLSLNG